MMPVWKCYNARCMYKDKSRSNTYMVDIYRSYLLAQYRKSRSDFETAVTKQADTLRPKAHRSDGHYHEADFFSNCSRLHNFRKYKYWGFL